MCLFFDGGGIWGKFFFAVYGILRVCISKIATSQTGTCLPGLLGRLKRYQHEICITPYLQLIPPSVIKVPPAIYVHMHSNIVLHTYIHTHTHIYIYTYIHATI